MSIVEPSESAAGDNEAPSAQDAIADAHQMGIGGIIKAAGPGLITGGADNDPAGVTTYSLVGAQSGYSQNWILLLSTPLLIVVQEMSARIGNVTKTDLAAAIRSHFGRNIAAVAVTLTVVANVITIGADLVMMAVVIGLITDTNFVYYIVPSTALMAYVTIFLDYRAVRTYLLWLVGVFAAYIVAAFLAQPHWSSALVQTVVPHIHWSPTYFMGAVGLLGTTITPYLFFWQSSAEVEERRGVQAIRRTNIDIIAGMIWSTVTAFFIIVSTAAVLYGRNSSVSTAADIARALEPLAGANAKYLFAIGIIGSALLAIPVLAASSAYSVAGFFGWRRGLGRRVNAAPQFYFVLGIAFLIGVQIAVSRVNPIKAVFYSQILDGLVAPVLVVLLLLLTSSRKVMGDFVNGRWTNILGALAVVVLLAADGAMIYSVATSGLP